MGVLEYYVRLLCISAENLVVLMPRVSIQFYCSRYNGYSFTIGF